VLGPLGRPFPPPGRDEDPVLIAGGIGLGPMFFLFRSLVGDVPASRPPVLLIGARTAELLPDPAVIPTGRVVLCTDDGTAGFRGTPVDYLRSPEGSTLTRHAVLYACGPRAMLAACHELSQACDSECWVSLEQVMGCGVGACMGCAVRTTGEQRYARVCTEGPVFRSGDIAW
jgi:dihydroorotate dehydrogenase electron transfer subunit